MLQFQPFFLFDFYFKLIAPNSYAFQSRKKNYVSNFETEIIAEDYDYSVMKVQINVVNGNRAFE